MEQSPSQKQLAAYMRSLSELYHDVCDPKIQMTREEAISRLVAIKKEQQKLIESGIHPITMRVAKGQDTAQGDAMRFKRENIRRSQRPVPHALDFKCQCKSCVSKYTITMEDRDLLKGMRISWGKTEEEKQETPAS